MPNQHKPLPQQPLPTQRPIGEEEEEIRQPSALRRALTRIGTVVLIVLALVLAYLFLLLGEPDEDAKNAVRYTEETIAMPMSPFEAPGESNVQPLADTFSEPVLSLYSGLSMQKARIYDTAFEGGYARRVTLTYAFEDGVTVMVESLRPTSAVTLLGTTGARLDATSLYSLGGLNAARMDDSQTIRVFGQSDTAVYAVTLPRTHADRLDDVLRQTTLIAPSYDNPT